MLNIYATTENGMYLITHQTSENPDLILLTQAEERRKLLLSLVRYMLARGELTEFNKDMLIGLLTGETEL